jgi:hypothetical protein
MIFFDKRSSPPVMMTNVQLLKSFAIGLRWVCAYVTNGTSPSHKLKMVNWSYRRAATRGIILLLWN